MKTYHQLANEAIAALKALNDVDRAWQASRKAGRYAAHYRHKGSMIDASFNKDGSIAYYVVEGGHGRFYSLDVAKEIAASRAERNAA